MQKTTFFLSLALIAQLSFAQQQQVVFDHYGLGEGFNSREALAITAAPNGMIWVSSNDGLARFDGKRFKFFQHVPGDTNSLTHNYCAAMQTDKRGWIWIQSDNDLDVFNPATEKFTHIRVNDAGKQRSVYPKSFRYDRENDMLWVATDRGLFFSENGSFQLKNISVLIGNTPLSTETISSITPENNSIWWVMSRYSIYKVNIQTKQLEKYDVPATVDNITNDRVKGNTQCAYLDSEKRLWIGTWTMGLIEFNTVTKQFHQYAFRDYKKEENTIYSITVSEQFSSRDILWVSTAGLGFASFDTRTKKFQFYSSNSFTDPLGINGTTYGLFAHPESGLWIGSAGGLHRIDYSKQFFSKIPFPQSLGGTKLMSVQEMAIQKVLNSSDEIAWFFIPYIGGYRYSINEKKYLPLPQKISKYINPPTGVFSFYIDRSNRLWIGTTQYGLVGYDIDRDEIIQQPNQYCTGTWKWATSFYEDKRGRLWIGTFDGLFVRQPNGMVEEITYLNTVLKLQQLATGIPAMTEDAAGDIWVTVDYSDEKNAVIVKINAEAGTVQFVYNEKQLYTDFAAPVDLRGIAFDGRDKIFTAFYGEGLASFSTTMPTASPVFLSMKQGINSNYISELCAAPNGDIWCSTGFGISRYTQKENTFRNYSYLHYPLDVDEPTICLSPGGNLYIGQSTAVRYFSIADANKNTGPCNLVFSELKVLNQPYSNNGQLYGNGDLIRLKHNQDMITVEFALLSYCNASENTYSWMLEGWDKDWIVSKDNTASYVNLSAGTYKLLVRAANNQGVWTKQPIELYFKISPPFYRTGWFITLCIATACMIIYWFVRQRINRLQEKFALRNKIAADLHDEIGSTLTSISILSNVSHQAMDQQPQQAKEMLQQISTQSKAIQQNMSDIVWSIRPDNEKMEDLVVRMREYAAQTLEALDIRISLHADERLVNKTLPMEYRKELLLIYKEAINNIAKHSRATTADTEIKRAGNTIHLVINDNGIWKGDSSGTGTKSMKERAIALGGELVITHDAAGTVVSAIIPIP